MKKSIIIGIVVLILLVGFLTIPVPYNITVGYTVKEPYSDLEYYYVSEPYTTTEYYYEREPYTICAGTSFWTGRCNKWKTEYSDVQKSRPVTKYKDVRKSRTVTKYRNVEKERVKKNTATLYEFASKKVKWYKHE